MKKMKFTLLLAIAAISFMFTGCKEEETPAPKNIVQIAQSDENFSILVQAVVRAGLVDELSADGPLTVFAPTNAAFAALLEELDADSLDDIDNETLISVLKYHVVSGKVLAGDLSDEQEVAPILGDQTFTIDLTGGAKIVDANDRVANITTTDIEASNGVIHVIDKVILPSFPK
jgi:transforming growth factor-beta-induced protein